jgi:hypothetical protein
MRQEIPKSQIPFSIMDSNPVASSATPPPPATPVATTTRASLTSVVRSIVVPSVAPAAAPEDEGPLPSCYLTNVMNPSETRAFTPKDLMERIEKAVKSFVDDVEDTPDWEPLYEKTNYTVKKKSSNQYVIVRVETVIPYSMLEIIKLVLDLKRQMELDSSKQSHDVLKNISNHTWIEYVKYKAVSSIFLLFVHHNFD